MKNLKDMVFNMDATKNEWCAFDKVFGKKNGIDSEFNLPRRWNGS